MGRRTVAELSPIRLANRKLEIILFLSECSSMISLMVCSKIFPEIDKMEKGLKLSERSQLLGVRIVYSASVCWRTVLSILSLDVQSCHWYSSDLITIAFNAVQMKSLQQWDKQFPNELFLWKLQQKSIAEDLFSQIDPTFMQRIIAGNWISNPKVKMEVILRLSKS